MPNIKMERFTQRARRVMFLAQIEAEELRHNFIGTEHLLMGLLREEGGIAGRVLRDLGLELRRVRELAAETSSFRVRDPADKTPVELAPSTKRVLEMAVDEARRMGHHYIGTEHLLLGLVRQSDGVAIEVLKRLGISPEEVRRHTRRTLQEQPVQASAPRQPEPTPPEDSPRLSESYRLAKTMLTQLLKMVEENKLTMPQAAELFSAVVPDIHLTADDNARLIGQFFRPDLLTDQQVHFTVTDMETNTVQATWESSLETVMRGIDRFIGAVLLPRLSKEVTFNEGDIRIVARIEKNAATPPPPPPTSDDKE